MSISFNGSIVSMNYVFIGFTYCLPAKVVYNLNTKTNTLYKTKSPQANWELLCALPGLETTHTLGDTHC